MTGKEVLENKDLSYFYCLSVILMPSLKNIYDVISVKFQALR